MSTPAGDSLDLSTGFNVFDAVQFERVPAVEVGPGCRRRDLPGLAGARAWIAEIDPGATWPVVDRHDTGELVLVLSGEMIEGERRLGPGSCLRFPPGSAHRPRSETGVRMFGINPL